MECNIIKLLVYVRVLSYSVYLNTSVNNDLQEILDAFIIKPPHLTGSIQH